MFPGARQAAPRFIRPRAGQGRGAQEGMYIASRVFSQSRVARLLSKRTCSLLSKRTITIIIIMIIIIIIITIIIIIITSTSSS